MGRAFASCISSPTLLPALVLTIGALLTTLGTVHAQDDDVDALKAKIASLQDTVDNAMQGREYLFNELNAANARAEVAEAEAQAATQGASSSDTEIASLRQELEKVTAGRDFLNLRSRELLAQTAAQDAELEQIAEVSFVQINSAIAERDAAREAASATAANEARLTKKLEMVTRGRAYLKERALEAEAESARNSKKLEMVTRGRAYLKERALQAEAEVQAANQRTSSSDAEVASLTQELEKITAGRDFLTLRARELLAQSAAKDAELEQIAEVSFVQINSAIAERDAAREAAVMSSTDSDSNDWAVQRSGELAASLASISGTEVVTTEDNQVSIKVGNTGLFQTGGTRLSDNGQAVLLQIGDLLAELNDAHISIVGHTDDRPVGAGSRFANNAELSFARASSALLFMNRNAGVSSDNLSASGLGDRYPIADNATAEGRTANRRVEILLSRK